MADPLDLNQFPRDVLWKRFEKSVVRRGPNECWEWKGRINRYGYAIIQLNNRRVMAHRIAFFLSQGSLHASQIVAHLCHNPLCTNPNHLAAGTQKFNLETSQKIGRLQRKIPIEDLPLIEKRRASGESLAGIARSYDCAKQSVQNAIYRHTLDDTNGRRQTPEKLITYKGITRTLTEWAETLGINKETLRFRVVRKKWPVEKAFTTPLSPGRRTDIESN